MHPDVLTTTPGAQSRSPFEADLWNRYYADWMNGFRAQEALWNDKDGGELIAMDPDGKTVGIAGALTATSAGLTVNVPATFNVNVTLGDAAGDTITVNGTLVANASASFNDDVALGNAAGDDVTVNGTSTFAAPATFNGAVTLGDAAGDAITINGTTTANANVTLTGSSVLTLPNGAANAPSLVVGDAGGLFRQAAGVLGFSAGGAERARLSSSGLILPAVPLVLGATVAATGDIRGTKDFSVQARDAANGADIQVIDVDGADNIVFGDVTDANTVYLAGSVAANLNVGGTNRIRTDTTGIGFFNTAPIAKPTVSGSRGGNAALADLLTELANLGLITDSSSA